MIMTKSFFDIDFGHSGRLKKGDQLLEANGKSLVGVSNSRYTLSLSLSLSLSQALALSLSVS